MRPQGARFQYSLHLQDLLPCLEKNLRKKMTFSSHPPPLAKISLKAWLQPLILGIIPKWEGDNQWLPHSGEEEKELSAT